MYWGPRELSVHVCLQFESWGYVVIQTQKIKDNIVTFAQSCELLKCMAAEAVQAVAEGNGAGFMTGAL